MMHCLFSLNQSYISICHEITLRLYTYTLCLDTLSSNHYSCLDTLANNHHSIIGHLHNYITGSVEIQTRLHTSTKTRN